MSLAWDIAKWAAKKAYPHAKRVWKYYEGRWQYMNETPQERAARRAAESAAHIAKQRVTRARARWDAARRVSSYRLLLLDRISRPLMGDIKGPLGLVTLPWDDLPPDVRRALAELEKEEP